MIKISVIIFIFLVSASGISQNLQIVPEKTDESYTLLKGQIDQKYNITMKLFVGGSCGFEDMAMQWRNRIIYGWYEYDNIKLKIPLIGYINFSDDLKNYYRVALNVPRNYSKDTLNETNCFINNPSELFYNNDDDYSFQSLTWKHDGKELPVKLNVIHENNFETVMHLKFIYLSQEMAKINITNLTKLNHIDDLKNIDVKEIGNKIHVTFLFYEWSRPGGSGGGHCGAGTENYLGYLRLNKDWSIDKFEFKFIESCWSYKVENYTVIRGKPELGLIKGE